MLEEHLTNLLASVAEGRRYWIRAPQDVTKPYVVLHRIDGTPNYHFCGRGTTESRFQANCFAGTYNGAKALARDVVGVLDTYSDVPAGIIAILIDSDGRDLAEEDAGPSSYLFATAVDFIVHHHT